MSEGVNNEPTKMTRRGFLRLLGIGATATALSACAPESSKKPELSFKEVGNYDKVPLNISGEAKEIVIVYPTEFTDKLQIRKRGEDQVVKPFEEGAEVVRILGEITDPTLYKVEGKSEILNEEIRVGVYPTTNGNLINDSGREDLGTSNRLYAIKVIVNGRAAQNYGIDNPPLEENKNYSKNNSLSVSKFGQGLAVGILENNMFHIQGYVCDSRAVDLK